MDTAPIIIEKLVAFKNLHKFSDTAWEERGLIPSSRELSDDLNDNFNAIVDNLISAIQKGKRGKQLSPVLKTGLKNFSKADYDTEEREFICDVFLRLARIIEIDFASDLNSWLYGSIFSAISKISKLLNPERVLATISQPCTKCDTELETFITEKKSGIPESTWFIVRCNNCSELNILSTGTDIKRLKFGNYEWVESLFMSEYSEEQALDRLEQLKMQKR